MPWTVRVTTSPVPAPSPRCEREYPARLTSDERICDFTWAEQRSAVTSDDHTTTAFSVATASRRASGPSRRASPAPSMKVWATTVASSQAWATTSTARVEPRKIEAATYTLVGRPHRSRRLSRPRIGPWSCLLPTTRSPPSGEVPARTGCLGSQSDLHQSHPGRKEHVMSLKGKVAVVTGGNSGIGKAVTLALAEAGANLVIDYVADEQSTEDLEKQVAALGDQAIGVKADVSKVADLQRLIDQAVKAMGRLDVMVNNAG